VRADMDRELPGYESPRHISSMPPLAPRLSDDTVNKLARGLESALKNLRLGPLDYPSIAPPLAIHMDGEFR